jgi:membrane dipeptidase
VKLLFLTISCSALLAASGQSYKKIHDEAIVIDGHNDILTAGVDSAYRFDSNLSGKAQSDLQRMKKAGIDVQVFSIWCDGDKKNAFSYANRQIDTLYAWIKRNPGKMNFVFTPNDLEKSVKQKKLGTMIGIEGGHMIENDLNKLDSFYKRGVRYMTLTWNKTLPWVSSAKDESRNTVPNPKKGLNDLGRQIVKRMNDLGMMIDISHLGEQSFRDVMRITAKPVIASHSCVYNLCPVYRNLKDEQIKAIAKNGGIIMINFYPGFLDSNWQRRAAEFDERHKHEEDSITKLSDETTMVHYLYAKYPEQMHDIDRVPMKLVIDHIDYIVKLVGVDYVGLGSDFDGMEDINQGLEGNGVLDFPKITKALLERGYKKADIQKILGKNFIRVFKSNCETSLSIEH